MFKAKMNLILNFIMFQKFYQNVKIYPRSEPYLPVGKTNRTFVQGWLNWEGTHHDTERLTCIFAKIFRCAPPPLTPRKGLCP